MKSKERHENWIKENAPEFDVDNFMDVSDGGSKKECTRCHNWVHRKELSSEDGICWFCRKCIAEDPEQCCGL